MLRFGPDRHRPKVGGRRCRMLRAWPRAVRHDSDRTRPPVEDGQVCRVGIGVTGNWPSGPTQDALAQRTRLLPSHFGYIHAPHPSARHQTASHVRSAARLTEAPPGPPRADEHPGVVEAVSAPDSADLDARAGAATASRTAGDHVQDPPNEAKCPPTHHLTGCHRSHTVSTQPDYMECDVNDNTIDQQLNLLLLLPETVNFPDGQQFKERLSETQDESPGSNTPVSITFYQCDVGRHGRSPEEIAVGELEKRLLSTNLIPADVIRDMVDEVERFTVVHAVTAFPIGHLSTDRLSEEIRTNSPVGAPFNRCIQMVDDYCRALQAATWTPCERISWHTIRAGRIWVQPSEGDPSSSQPQDGFRFAPGTSARIGDAEFGPEVKSQFESRVGELRSDQLSLNWVERFYDAQRAYRRGGDYAVALILLQTASEILIDTTLMTLLWEDGEDAERVSKKFVEGAATKRLVNLQHLLGGYWRRDRHGPVADWFDAVVTVRNRVVHAGYQPTYEEASRAVDAVLSLQRHIFDRVAAKSRRFSRSAKIFMGEDGLKRRGAWTNATANFYRSQAEAEDGWLPSVRSWRERMYRARDETVDEER